MTTAEKARQVLVDSGVRPDQFTPGSFWQGVANHLAETIDAAVTVAVARHEEANQRAGEILIRAMLPGGPVDRTAVASAAGLLAAARLSTHPLPPATRAELDAAYARGRKELEGALRDAADALEGVRHYFWGTEPPLQRESQVQDAAEEAEKVARRALAGSEEPTPAPDARAVLTELLRLYDWRFELAEREKDPRNAEKDFKAETRRLLNKYGTEKKSAWEAARRALGAAEPTRT